LAGHIACIGEKRNTYRIGLRKPGEKRPRLRSVNNIKMDLSEIWWGCIDCIDLAQDRDQYRALVNTVMNFRVP
jgi:hypothetical protein